MPKLTADAKVQVAGGPALAFSTALTIEAYDRIEVIIKAGQNDVEVEIQPGKGHRVKVLVIKSSIYDDSHNLKYRPSTASDAWIDLDGPQIFIGSGALSLFGENSPTSLVFTNDLAPVAASDANDARIDILVARDATPDAT